MMSDFDACFRDHSDQREGFARTASIRAPELQKAAQVQRAIQMGRPASFQCYLVGSDTGAAVIPQDRNLSRWHSLGRENTVFDDKTSSSEGLVRAQYMHPCTDHGRTRCCQPHHDLAEAVLIGLQNLEWRRFVRIQSEFYVGEACSGVGL